MDLIDDMFTVLYWTLSMLMSLLFKEYEHAGVHRLCINIKRLSLSAYYAQLPPAFS